MPGAGSARVLKDKDGMRNFLFLLFAIFVLACLAFSLDEHPGPATWTVRVDGVEQTVTGVSVSEALEQYGAWAGRVLGRCGE